jgi:NAD(P)H-flavin reductase
VLLTLPIREVIQATPRARIVRLDLGDHNFPYQAGQAVMLGAHGDARRRPYSIASAPDEARRDRTLELLVGIDPSDAAAFAPVVGGLVDVDGPLGSFTFPANPVERRFLFVAGGTGIAPLHAMLRCALAMPHDSIGFVYSARTPDDFAYADEFRALAAAGQIELRQTITRSAAADWTGARGRVTRDALADLIHDPATLCFVCGPPALVEEVPRMLEGLGIARERIRIEEQ